ncbi:hypothetical protein K474DRAFT_1350066 [Panus rudis PR-1116 ss-1]|nr:hypothetical protein K474DRAFT_1350066 [Panus rudis PR-1116 ss-1]
MSSSKLVYNGTTVDLDVFMPRKAFWRSARAFTGSDGRKYTWHQSISSCYLDLEDRSQPAVTIAEFKQRSILKGRKAYLEIHPQGEHMADLIVITWLYYETRRRENERGSDDVAIVGA